MRHTADMRGGPVENRPKVACSGRYRTEGRGEPHRNWTEPRGPVRVSPIRMVDRISLPIIAALMLLVGTSACTDETSTPSPVQQAPSTGAPPLFGTFPAPQGPPLAGDEGTLSLFRGCIVLESRNRLRLALFPRGTEVLFAPGEGWVLVDEGGDDRIAIGMHHTFLIPQGHPREPIDLPPSAAVPDACSELGMGYVKILEVSEPSSN